eukprot:4550893-Lingulodinium_polyedra.AAC.1
MHIGPILAGDHHPTIARPSPDHCPKPNIHLQNILRVTWMSALRNLKPVFRTLRFKNRSKLVVFNVGKKTDDCYAIGCRTLPICKCFALCTYAHAAFYRHFGDQANGPVD